MANTSSDDDRANSLAGWILIVILGAIGVCLIAAGGSVYAFIVGEWADSASGFSGPEGWVGWIFGMAAALAIAVGLIFVGIGLRLARWRHAPLASLGLSVLAVGFIIFTYYVFSDTNTSSDSFEILLLQGCCILLLLLVALPPFLHWAMAKPATTRLPTEPRR
jgi:hypothetical protein